MPSIWTSQGYGRTDVASTSGVHRNSVKNYIKLYNAGGLEGNKTLFEGLWIENQWDWSHVNPLIHIQFNEIGYKTVGLEVALHKTLDEHAAAHGLLLKETSYDRKFRELI